MTKQQAEQEIEELNEALHTCQFRESRQAIHREITRVKAEAGMIEGMPEGDYQWVPHVEGTKALYHSDTDTYWNQFGQRLRDPEDVRRQYDW